MIDAHFAFWLRRINLTLGLALLAVDHARHAWDIHLDLKYDTVGFRTVGPLRVAEGTLATYGFKGHLRHLLLWRLLAEAEFTARLALKKCLKRSEGLDFLGRRGSNFLIRFGPLGPKPDPLVVTTAFAEVNFVEKVSGQARRACLARFARRFVQKCELFLDFSDFASE